MLMLFPPVLFRPPRVGWDRGHVLHRMQTHNFNPPTPGEGSGTAKLFRDHFLLKLRFDSRIGGVEPPPE